MRRIWAEKYGDVECPGLDSSIASQRQKMTLQGQVWNHVSSHGPMCHPISTDGHRSSNLLKEGRQELKPTKRRQEVGVGNTDLLKRQFHRSHLTVSLNRCQKREKSSHLS